MKNKEIFELVKKIYEKNEYEYDVIGLRFENKERKIGDICECSKHNIDREDERDFPEFGTEEYKEMYEFNGTSAWNLYGDCSNALRYALDNLNKDVKNSYETAHCYVIVGDRITNIDDDLDYNEIVIPNAKVLAKIF